MLFIRKNTYELVDAFLQSKSASGRAPGTLENYRYLLNPFALTHNRVPLKPATIELFLHAHAGHSDETHASQFGRLRAFYRWMVVRGYLRENDDPFSRGRLAKPRIKRKLPRVLSIPQLRRAVQVTRGGHERALVLTLVDTGARIGELAGCTKSDLQGTVLRVSGKGGDRLVPITPMVASYLRELPTFYLFPRMGSFGVKEIVDIPAHEQTLSRRVRSVLKRSGLTGPKLGSHILRHSFATHFLNRSKDLYALARLLGHTSVRMAERYVNLDPAVLVASHKSNSPVWAISGLKPVTPARRLPTVDLSRHLADVPIEIDGDLVAVMLVEDRRPMRTWYYLRARAGRVRWHISSLGSDLLLDTVDGIRQAVATENRRRHAI